jgi:hypothetical protein
MNGSPDDKAYDKQAVVKALATMLDYAIIEGAELRLPVFVFMLRTARLELINSVKGDKGAMAQDITSKEALAIE